MNKETSNKFDINNYLFNQDSKLGIYIIHGFSSTTYEVKKIAQHLANQGYHVKADNLPGHGTTIEDCNSTKYHEWLTFVEQNVAELYTYCDKVIVMGVSMGGVLALYLGTVFPLDGIISASPLIKFKKEFDVRVLARLFHRFKPTIKKESTFHPDQLKVSRVAFYGYNCYPVVALNEMRKLIDKVKINLHKISSPVLLIHSKVDKTALFKNYHIIKSLLKTSNLSTLVVEKTGHHVFDPEESDKEEIFTTISDFTKTMFNE